MQIVSFMDPKIKQKQREEVRRVITEGKGRILEQWGLDRMNLIYKEKGENIIQSHKTQQMLHQ